jgi:cardiolipin synthase
VKTFVKENLTIPNFLTLFRVLLIPIFVVLFYREYLVSAVLVLFVSGLSDFFDGKIARKYGQITEFGKLFDPLADKATQITIAVILFFEFHNPKNTDLLRAFSWIFLVFLVKELFQLVFVLFMLIVGLRPGAAEIFGKIATFIFYAVMLIIIVFGPNVGVVTHYFPQVVLPDFLLIGLVAVSAAATVTAFLSYIPSTYRCFKTERWDKKKAKKTQKANVKN